MKIAEKICFWAILYPFGLISGVIFYFFVIIGRIKIKNWRTIWKIESGSVVAPTHGSPLGPFTNAFLFLPRYALHPQRYVPICTPDKENYYDHPLYAPLRQISIPISRADNKSHSDRMALLKMTRISQKKKGIIILFLEGTRTFKAVQAGKAVYSQTGKPLGVLREDACKLIARFGMPVVPIWCDGEELIVPNSGKMEGKLSQARWHLVWEYAKGFLRLLRHGMVIKIGEPISLPRGISGPEASKIITNALLQLADQ